MNVAMWGNGGHGQGKFDDPRPIILDGDFRAILAGEFDRHDS